MTLGRMARLSGRIDAPLGVTQRLQVIFKRSPGGVKAQGAVTDFEVLGRGREVSLVRLTPRTGRRHQLRAHLAALGHPIAGDKLYALSDRDYLSHLRGRLGEASRRSLLAERQMLHALRLRFPHPSTHEPVDIVAPVPEDMADFLSAHGIDGRGSALT